ncbi:rod shape-determining protein MreC [Candidatus Nomurabacteria bacterium]|nr:rod shape-determining protein MreC [Candidatus Nomurabacteria bacterium]
MITVLVLVFFKTGRIFDIGLIFRQLPEPQRTVNNLLIKPENIEEEYKKLLAENSQLQALAQENKELRALLSLKKEKDYQLVVANILSRDLINQNLLVLDFGSQQGVKVGQAVVVDEGVIVGKIIEVREEASVARLLTDNLSKIAVSVGQDQLVSGILEGSLGLGMKLRYIPQEQEIKKGDLVVSSPLSENIPAGLVVGQIEKVEFSEEELFKEAIVSPLVDYNTLAYLGIILEL